MMRRKMRTAFHFSHFCHFLSPRNDLSCPFCVSCGLDCLNYLTSCYGGGLNHGGLFEKNYWSYSCDEMRTKKNETFPCLATRISCVSCGDHLTLTCLRMRLGPGVEEEVVVGAMVVPLPLPHSPHSRPLALTGCCVVVEAAAPLLLPPLVRRVLPRCLSTSGRSSAPSRPRRRPSRHASSGHSQSDPPPSPVGCRRSWAPCPVLRDSAA